MQLLFFAQPTNSYPYFWAAIFQFGIIGALILLGNILRRKTPFFRNYLIPTGLIAGFIGLGLKYIFTGTGLTISGAPIIDEDYMHFVTYHSLAIGFIALTLVSAAKPQKKDGRPIKSGILIVTTYLIQGVLGVALSILVGLMFAGSAISKAPYAGVLLPLGFGQGPGQAGNIGGSFETLLDKDGNPALNALVGGRDFGLSVAALGFLIATIVGTIILNVMNRRGVVKRIGSEAVETFGGFDESSYIDQPDEIPVVESVDKFTIQIAFVLTTYLITFGLISLINFLVVDLAGLQSFQGIIWGFNFLFALIVTMIIKAVLNTLRRKKIMKRQYINNYMQNRIAGLAFDVMIATAIMSINFGKLNDPSFWVLLGVMGVFATILSYFYINFMAKRYFPDTRWYTFFAFFGMLTGTASEGVALLREIDPHFKTGVAEDLVNGSGTAAIFGAPMLIIITFITQSTLLLWVSLGLLIVLFLILLLAMELYVRHKSKNDTAIVEVSE